MSFRVQAYGCLAAWLLARGLDAGGCVCACVCHVNLFLQVSSGFKSVYAWMCVYVWVKICYLCTQKSALQMLSTSRSEQSWIDTMPLWTAYLGSLSSPPRSMMRGAFRYRSMSSSEKMAWRGSCMYVCFASQLWYMWIHGAKTWPGCSKPSRCWAPARQANGKYVEYASDVKLMMQIQSGYKTRILWNRVLPVVAEMLLQESRQILVSQVLRVSILCAVQAKRCLAPRIHRIRMEIHALGWWKCRNPRWPPQLLWHATGAREARPSQQWFSTREAQQVGCAEM